MLHHSLILSSGCPTPVFKMTRLTCLFCTCYVPVQGVGSAPAVSIRQDLQGSPCSKTWTKGQGLRQRDPLGFIMSMLTLNL